MNRYEWIKLAVCNVTNSFNIKEKIKHTNYPRTKESHVIITLSSSPRKYLILSSHSVRYRIR